MEADGIGREEGQAVAQRPRERAGRRFPKAQRLRRSEDIQQVLKSGRRLAMGGLQLLALRKPGAEEARAGFIVKRRMGCAVRRNLMKRRMREAYREVKTRVDGGCDLVFSATTAMEYGEVRRNLEGLLAKAGALGVNDEKA